MPRDYGNAEGLWVGIMLNEHARGRKDGWYVSSFGLRVRHFEVAQIHAVNNSDIKLSEFLW